MPSAAAPPPASEREDRVFTAAFGVMDSSQDGEAVAAFLRVRDLLHRHRGSFRSLLERYDEARRLNEELGRQNAELLRENAALRARDSRPVPPAASGRAMSPIRGFRHWDLGVLAIIGAWAAYGPLHAATAFALAAAVLICAAFTHWFSPFRFIAGALLAFAAYAVATSAHAKTALPAATPASAASDDGPGCGSGRVPHRFNDAPGH